jgi:hypothetical protein
MLGEAGILCLETHEISTLYKGYLLDPLAFNLTN